MKTRVLRILSLSVPLIAILLAFGLTAQHVQARRTDPIRDLGRVFGVGQPAAQPIATGARWRACFTPGQDCEGLAVALIDDARETVQLQAYGFTSAPIAKALVRAQARGVRLSILIDKEARQDQHSQAPQLIAAGVPVAVDDRPAIAHNKVLIVDAATAVPVVVTGSFNWTRGAQDRNAENLLVIEAEPAITAAYAAAFDARRSISTPWR